MDKTQQQQSPTLRKHKDDTELKPCTFSETFGVGPANQAADKLEFGIEDRYTLQMLSEFDSAFRDELATQLENDSLMKYVDV